MLRWKITNLYKTRLIGTGRMRWAENVSRVAEMKIVYKIVFRKPERARHLGDLGAEERIILKWIRKKNRI
jgi:hypothetical protein